MREQVLQAEGLSFRRPVLKEMLHHKICECMPRQSFQIIQQLIQQEAYLLLAAMLQ